MKNNKTTDISDLTLNIWHIICGYLDQHDLEHIKNTNKFYHQLITNKSINSEGATFFKLAPKPKRKLCCDNEEIKLRVEKVTRSSIYAMLPINKELIAIASGISTLEIYNHKEKKMIGNLTGHMGEVKTLCLIYFSSLDSNNPHLISGDEDGVIKIWDIKEKKCIMTLKGHTQAINGLIVIPSVGIISISDDTDIRIWNPFTGQCIDTIVSNYSHITGIACCGKNRIVTTSDDERFKIWDLIEKKCLSSNKISLISKNCVLSLFNNNHILCAGLDGGLGIIDASKRKILINGGSKRGINHLIQLSSGEIAASFDTGYIEIFDRQNLQQIASISFYQSQQAIAELPNGTLVCGSQYGEITFISFPMEMKHKTLPQNNYEDMDTSEEMLYDQYLSHLGN